MSVLGQNPDRDKKARIIIFGSYFVLSSVASILRGAMGVPPNIGRAQLQKQRERAWDIYCRTGDIKKATKILFVDS